jgi:tetratricopeptide (TPR) repeat protein
VLEDCWQKVRITADRKLHAMNQVGEKQSKAPTISLDELSRRLFSPYEIPKPAGDEAEPSDQSLSYIAWQLKQSHANNDRSSSSFPTFSYLDLRRQQNTAWATDRLTEGNAILFEDPRKAENLYKQGLDLVPDHVELLVGYGKLLAQTKRRPLALAKFLRALEVDPSCISAKENLERVRQHEILLRQESRKVAAPVLRESSAFQDVLLERSLAQEAPVEEEHKFTEEELREDERKHKKRRKKHKRRKRGRSPSPTPSSSSGDASEDSSRRNKKRKRNRPSPSLSSAREEGSLEDNSSREERRRHRKHRKHHKHRSKRKHKKRKRSDSPST